MTARVICPCGLSDLVCLLTRVYFVEVIAWAKSENSTSTMVGPAVVDKRGWAVHFWRNGTIGSTRLDSSTFPQLSFTCLRPSLSSRFKRYAGYVRFYG